MGIELLKITPAPLEMFLEWTNLWYLTAISLRYTIFVHNFQLVKQEILFCSPLSICRHAFFQHDICLSYAAIMFSYVIVKLRME